MGERKSKGVEGGRGADGDNPRKGRWDVADLIGVFATAVEVVGHSQLGVKPPAEDQFEEGELGGGEG